jgi:hypothetical protein
MLYLAKRTAPIGGRWRFNDDWTKEKGRPILLVCGNNGNDWQSDMSCGLEAREIIKKVAHHQIGQLNCDPAETCHSNTLRQ